MPFTLSHATAVLPGLRQDRNGRVAGRGPLVASALVAGSFAPDVPYFADSVLRGVFGYGEITHGPLGVVLVDPLLAAVMVGGWFALRGPLTALLPERWQGRAGAVLGYGAGRRPSSPRTAGWFWVSAVVGSATHVVWDAFTHPGRWGVRLLPFLDQGSLAGVPMYRVAQYGSSAVGLVVVAGALVRALRAAPADAPRPGRVPRLSRRARLWAAAGLAAGAAVGAVARCWRWYDLYPWAPAADALPIGLFGAGAGLVPAALACAAAVHLAARRPAPGPDSDPAPEAPGQWAADSQSAPTPTETSSGASNG